MDVPCSLFSYIIFVNVGIVLIFVIYTNITWLFVIIKEGCPEALVVEEDVVVQVNVQEHGVNIQDRFNDSMEELMLITQLKKMWQIYWSRRHLIMMELMMMTTILMVFFIYMCLRRQVNLFMKAPKQVFSLPYCCWWT